LKDKANVFQCILKPNEESENLMYNIDHHPLIPMYVVGDPNSAWMFIGYFSCCEVNAHYFKNEKFLGITVCDECGQIEAVFELFEGSGEGAAVAIYTLINIENVREFAGCKTVEECELVANALSSSSKLAA